MSSSPQPNTKIHLHLNYPQDTAVPGSAEQELAKSQSSHLPDSSIAPPAEKAEVVNQQQAVQGEILTAQPLQQKPNNSHLSRDESDSCCSHSKSIVPSYLTPTFTIGKLKTAHFILTNSPDVVEKITLNPFARSLPEYSSAIASILVQNDYNTSTNSSVQEQQRLFACRKKELIFVASLARDFRLRQIEMEFENEKRAALQDHSIERDSLKERMIAELMERRKRASEDSDYFESSESSNNKAFAPSLLPVQPQAEQASAGRKSKRRAEMEASKFKRKNIADIIGGNAALLGEGEILEDLFLIFGENSRGSGAGGSSFAAGNGANSGAGNAASGAGGLGAGKRKAKSNFTETAYNYIVYIKEQDDAFSYDGITYRKGDDVVVEKEDQDDVLGEIVSITNSEVWIKAADGVRIKVSISQLRLGKAFISHAGTR